jgi:hypothetical protein
MLILIKVHKQLTYANSGTIPSPVAPQMNVVGVVELYSDAGRSE